MGRRSLSPRIRTDPERGWRERTLSPKPHILARIGCWTTSSDQMRPSWMVDTGAR